MWFFFTVRSHVFEARIEVENNGNIRMITVKSNSTGDKKLKYTQILILTYALKQASSKTAALLLRDNRTEFAATVRNCVNKNKLSVSFIAHLSSLSHDRSLWNYRM